MVVRAGHPQHRRNPSTRTLVSRPPDSGRAQRSPEPVARPRRMARPRPIARLTCIARLAQRHVEQCAAWRALSGPDAVRVCRPRSTPRVSGISCEQCSGPRAFLPFVRHAWNAAGANVRRNLGQWRHTGPPLSDRTLSERTCEGGLASCGTTTRSIPFRTLSERMGERPPRRPVGRSPRTPARSLGERIASRHRLASRWWPAPSPVRPLSERIGVGDICASR